MQLLSQILTEFISLIFMVSCIVNTFQNIPNKMQLYIVYFYLETALHVLGGTSTYHQERIQLYLQHLVFVTPLLLPAATVEECELFWVYCGWPTPPTAQTPDAVDTVVCALYDGWRYHPKHVQQFPDINKLCNVASCWIYIGKELISVIEEAGFNPLKTELNPICYLLALLAHHFLHVSRIRVKSLTLRLLMSYIYGAPILDVSRSHTTTQHSR